jgi:hypothetical protein
MPDGLVLIVCGGRDYPNRPNVFRVMGKIHGKQPIRRIITGACKKKKSQCELSGADRWAQEWDITNEVSFLGIPAPWRTLASEGEPYFRAAGPVRNGWMLEEPKIDGVLGFPSEGTGTDDMCRKAKGAGLRVRVADDDGNLREWSEPDAK